MKKRVKRAVKTKPELKAPRFTKARADLHGRIQIALTALLDGKIHNKDAPSVGGWRQGWHHLDLMCKYGVLEQNEDRTWSVTPQYRLIYEALQAMWKDEWEKEQRQSARTAGSRSATNELALS